MNADVVNTVTGLVEQAAAPDRKQEVLEFITGHTLRHAGSADTWNLPFVHVQALEIFKYDWVMLPLAVVLLVAVVGFGYRRRAGATGGCACLAEMFVLFIRDRISIPYLGESDGRRMTPLFCSLFLFILFLNLLGLIPLFSSATGNISVTAALALITFSVMVFGTIAQKGLVRFLGAFILPGVPIPIKAIMFPLEVLSVLTKTFALTIRLFANMLAGHIVIFALLGLIVIVGYVALPIVLLVVGIYYFELFVAFFQAYIFTLLSALFIGQMYHPSH